jgi:aryl-alcohol dehydrogenase-like predicted oxidoreductase
MNFGWGTSEADLFKMMDAALDAGINFFDTANVYGFTDTMGEGLTEQIIGPRTMEQLTGSLHALDIQLDEKTLTELDTIWPGPGGEAPEAYAW